MIIQLARRLRARSAKGLLLTAAVLPAIVVPLTACDPPVNTSHPPLHHYFEPSFHIVDGLGNTVYKAGAHEDVTTVWPSTILQSGSVPWGYAVGWNSLYSGSSLELKGEPGAGVTGAWQADRPITTVFHAQINYTLWGYGFHLNRGTCTLTDYITSFGENLNSRGVTSYCNQLGSRPWAETGAGYVPEGTPANRARYYKLTPAQKAKVMDTINAGNRITLKAVRG